MDLRERPQQFFARHPWETARAGFFCRVVRDANPAGTPLRVLDVGAGDGFVARALLPQLPAGSTVECYDANYTDEMLRTLQAESPAIGFHRQPPEKTFDLIMMLDVLEHVPDDVQLLSRFSSTLLAANGRVLISVPAYMGLFTQHDITIGHYRRYDAPGMRDLIADAGLQPIISGTLFHSLLLPRLLTKVIEVARGVHSIPAPEQLGAQVETDLGRWRAGQLTTRLVDAALAVDTRVSRLAAALRIRPPGLSKWALASFAPESSAHRSRKRSDAR
jgi:SAM-dependent methyltransferase